MSDTGLYLLIAVKAENRGEVVNKIVISLDHSPKKNEVIRIGDEDQTSLRYTNYRPRNKVVTVVKKLHDNCYFKPMDSSYPTFLVIIT